MLEREHILLRTLLQDLPEVFQRTGLPGVCDLPLPQAFEPEEAFSASSSPAPAERLERLRPIFDILTQPANDHNSTDHPGAHAASSTRYPLKSLSLSPEDALPRYEEDITGYLREDYRQIWQAFLEEMQALQRSKDFHTYFFTVFFLLKKYFSRVPSREHTDISLFDAARIATAAADCRYHYQLTQHSKHGGHSLPLPDQANLSSVDDDALLLIGTRICGIQTFLNRMAPGREPARLTQRLRGRSFYLYLLTETVAEYLMQQLGLTVAHKVWCTGGHILLLAPNTPEITYHLKACAHDIHEFLFEKFHGDLAITLDYVPASTTTLSESGGQVYLDLQGRLERERRRKLCAVLQEQPSWQFPAAEGDEQQNVASIPEQYAEQERLGARFPRLNQPDGRLVKKIKPADESWKEPPLVEFAIGRNLHIGWDINPGEYAQTDTIYRVNNLDETFWGGSSTKYGFKLLAVHVDTYTAAEADQVNMRRSEAQPASGVECANSDDLKPFADMASNEAGKYLGVLRMDVDAFGVVFAGGLPPAKCSLARLAALSADLEFFFSGYVNGLCRAEFRKNTAIVYSGDDDVCIAGAWDSLVELACRIRQDFRAFTCRNLSISGGLFVCKRNYPLHRAAEHAGQALILSAKENAATIRPLRGAATTHNSLAIFQQRFTWDDFLRLRETGDRLAAAIANGDLSRHAVRGLLRLHRTWKRERQLNTARLFYLTARTIRNRACRDLLVAQQQHLEHDSYIPALVRYVTLKTRHNS